MNPFLLLPLLSLLSVSWTHFSSEDGDYSLDINARATFQRQELPDGYLDVFNIMNESTKAVDYMITVTKLNYEEASTMEELLSESYKQRYQSSCNCEVAEVKQLTYTHFEGVRYQIRITDKGPDMVGQSVMIPKGTTLYNVIFLTSEAFLPNYQKEFKHSINSMQLYK